MVSAAPLRGVLPLESNSNFQLPTLSLDCFDQTYRLFESNKLSEIYDQISRFQYLWSLAMSLNTAHEIEILKKAIQDFGTVNGDGHSSVSYGILFDKTADTLEALNGTLRAAKRQKKVTFNAELLMMPKDKDVQVVWIE